MATVLDPHALPFDRWELPTVPVKRWTVAEYHRLLELGMLRENDPYELIDGWLVPKMTKNPSHNAAVRRLDRIFQTRLAGMDWVVDCQNSVTLDDGEPEPDLMVLIGPESRYDDRHPLAQEVALLIEVSDSTLDRDRGVKLRSYARAKISQYWIVNIKACQIEVFTSPQTLPTAPYASVRTFGADETISVIIGGQSHFDVAVSDILTS